MRELGGFKFDKMAVSTDLAMEYFKQKSNKFRSITKEKLEKALSEEFDGYNAIEITNTTPSLDNYVELSSEQINIIHGKLLKLAKLVQQNAETFGQIEYLIRKIPVKEVKEFDIKLIVQNLSCRNYMLERHLEFGETDAIGIQMGANTPLANIGFVAQILMIHSKVLILATKETAAVSSLFVDLCHKVGLNTVEVIFQTKIEDSVFLRDMVKIPVFMRGCVGVITERSDVDSAVDSFLGTTTWYPWKLRRVFVQESIYDKFKKTMAWKAESTDQTEPYKKLCDNIYVCDGKTFLLDYSGTPESAGTGILVEAYRTTKELKTLVTKYGSLYTSVWSSDISEANEIAHKVPSSIVWINSYGIFDGSPASSQAIYKELWGVCVVYQLVCIEKKDLIAMQADWSKKTFNQRRETLYLAATDFLKDEKNASYTKGVNEFIAALRDVEGDDFVHVENGRMCVGVTAPTNLVVVRRGAANNASCLAKLLASGSAVLINIEKHYVHEFSLEIPISYTEFAPFTGDKVAVVPYSSRTKVIWTNFGTTFAN